MFEVKRALKTILEEIDGLTVIRSSRASVRTEHTLPAVVLDLDSVRPETTAENGSVVAKQHRIPMSVHVATADLDDDAAEDALETQIDTVLAKIEEHHGSNWAFEDFVPMEVPFGRQQALCGSFMLVLFD